MKKLLITVIIVLYLSTVDLAHGTMEKLKAEYQHAVIGSTQQQTDEAWKAYKLGVYNITGDQEIFHILQRQAKIDGQRSANTYFNKDKLTVKEFYQSYLDSIKTYCDGLEEVGLATFKPNECRDYARYILEGFKGFDATIGMNTRKLTREQFKEVCYILSLQWYKITDLIHKDKGLVLARWDGMYSSPEEYSAQADDKNQYVLNGLEQKHYENMVK